MKRTFALSCLLLALLAAHATAQSAPVPAVMNFQGRVAKPDGTPVADGTYSVRFSLWDAASGGAEKWNQTLNVAAKNGTFAVALSGFPANAFNNNLWLEIKIGSDSPLTPRQPLVSVAYAMKADSVKDGAITSASIADGTIGAADLAPGVLNPLAWLLGGNAGTTAQDFFAAFKVGMDDKHISTVDADGVALAAIQGLHTKMQRQMDALKTENASIKAENLSLRTELDALKAAVSELQAQRK